MTSWIWENLGTIAILESCTEDGVIIVDVRDLNDGETDVKKVMKKIEIIGGLLAVGCRIAVRCVGGLNRSNCIAIAVMSYLVPHGDLEETWEFHWKFTKERVPRMHIVPELEKTCKKALKPIRQW